VPAPGDCSAGRGRSGLGCPPPPGTLRRLEDSDSRDGSDRPGDSGLRDDSDRPGGSDEPIGAPLRRVIPAAGMRPIGRGM